MEARQGGVDGVAWGLMVLTVMTWAGSWIAMKMVVPYIGP
ncbi:MAG TPA: EamA family transporter, partial [Bordetella sp.]|nr:EamA family transporter [Bordetella sp.]